jgi:cell division protein FtsI (penicillin-binding protein 3)
VVIFDSPMAPTITQREGGWQGAPVFNRIAQQVLEYMHTPHDTEIPTNKVLLARAKANDKDLEEGSPDHPGDDIDEMQPAADALAESKPQQNSKPSPVSGSAPSSAIVTAALRQTETLAPPERSERSAATATDSAVPNLTTGTVVVDVEQGGIVVPSFLGKSVRSSIEMAQDSGLELDVVGSGKALDQSPAPGSHVASGTRITVKFGR